MLPGVVFLVGRVYVLVQNVRSGLVMQDSNGIWGISLSVSSERRNLTLTLERASGMEVALRLRGRLYIH